MSHRTKGHDYLGWALVAIALLAPLPLGGIRPFFWMFNAAAIALMGLFYAYGLHRGAVRPRMPLSTIGMPVLLFSLAIVWLIVQILPLGILAAPAWADLGGVSDVSGRISVFPGGTFGMLIRYLTYAMFFVLALQVFVEKRRARLLVRVVFWGIAVHSLLALASLIYFGDTLLFLPKFFYLGDATGTFVNRNSFATFAAFGVILGVSLVVDEAESESGHGSAMSRTIVRLGFYAAPLALIALALAFSHSRMGMFVAGVGSAAIALVAVFKTTGAQRLFAGGLIVAGLLAGIALANTGGLLFDRLDSVDQDADFRLNIYTQTLELIATRPMTGYGGGAYEDAFKAVKHDPLTPERTIDAAHDLYLELMSELGIPIALAVVLSVAIPATVCAVAAVRRRHNWQIPAAAAAVVLAGGLHSLVDFSLHIPAVVLLMLLILAAGLAQSQTTQSQSQGG